MLLVFAIALAGCQEQVTELSRLPLAAHPIATPVEKTTDPEILDNIFVGEDRLSYNSFDVVKLAKRIRFDSQTKTDVSYAVLKKNGRILAKFDGDIYFGGGNATDFGLFSFLGGVEKQLLVSQTIPRSGRYWIVDLSSDEHVIFDSGDYGVGREDFYVIDIDKDGVYEISLPVTAFYMFENMDMSETPLPEIIFKYNEKLRKYLPANKEFQEYSLRNLDSDIKNLELEDSNHYLSKRLDIVLRYIYAGRKDDAWTFFEKQYRRPDRKEIKSKIEAILKKEEVYKYLYGSR